ncbi:MAG TPA: 1-deoxy-D-xylulose-5-phosphate reductoisomerase, partial [Armatimonadetes bacterium]|nr:1-deoxy-D-xylulose-5-phosphate reductoisomerase [Armatimonadota bacterium]
MKKLALLGSTGSIGTQVLDVVEKLPDRLQVVSLATNRNIELIAEQANRHRPAVVSVGREEDAARLRELLTSPQSIEIVWGDAGLVRAATVAEADVAVISVAGTVGLAPTIKAIEARKDIALASKEVLVAAGSLVNRLVAEKGVKLLPIDSEHSAIFQCLQGADLGKVRRLMLTASGGALAGYNIEDLANVTVEQALAHPTWSMGRKITIDSATLMNKCLEIIEAHWLFGVDTENIEVIIHPQSIVHSMVEFVDGSVLAQMGIPDMRIPIQYALLYPERVDTGLPRLDLIEKGTLTFLKPDLNRYPALELAYKASRAGGTMPAVMNAANEVSVS